jgi:diguanylate cyclase (GGDEF)-like protein
MWLLVRWLGVCLVLAAPIAIGAGSRLHANDLAISTLASERNGLRCTLNAGGVLAAIQRYRLTVVGPWALSLPAARAEAGAIADALRELHSPVCAAFVKGPRTNLPALESGAREMAALADPAVKAQASLGLANNVLVLLLDIGDGSGLTYDASVESVNLQDALAARILVGTERLQQGAQMLELAGRRHDLTLADLVPVEKLAGEAHANNVMANDDLDGALLALPALSSTLNPAREEADRTEAALTRAVDRAVAGGGVGKLDLRALRVASIDGGQRLMRTAARVLETSFDTRVAALQRDSGFVVAVGPLLIVGAWGIAAWLWQTLRRRHQAELERAHERAKILEAQLARGNAERALRVTEMQFRAVFDGSDVGIAIVDCNGRIEANAALRSMFDHDLGLIAHKAAEMFGAVVGDRRDSFRTEHCFIKSDGEKLWAELSLSAVRGGTDDAVSAVVLVHDVTEHKTLNARLDHETLHDALTGLPNRVQFIRRLGSMIGKAERFAVVFVDLDGFKAVNDALGHHAGDEVLREAGFRLSSAVRPVDLVARLHGDEFAVIIRDISLDAGSAEIEDIVGRLHDALNFSIETPAAPLRISASIGYVREGAAYRDAERLLRDADSAMYLSKVGGRDRTTVYEPAITSSSVSLRP